MFKKIATASAAAILLTSAMAPVADAYPHHSRYYYQHHARYHHRANYHRCRTVGGTLTGAVLGGVLGSAVTHHSGAGTIIGAGVGGVAGHQIARDHCRR